MGIKRYCRYIHLWLSLPTGVLISIICFTSAILVFKEGLLAMMGYESICESLLMIVMKLHRWLMDDTRTTGKMMVSISTLLFIFMLISELTIHWPRKWKKSRLTIEHQKGKRRFMSSLHSVLGFRGALILLVRALTGLMWSLQWYRGVVSLIFDVEVKRGVPVWKVVRALHLRTYAGMFSEIIAFIAALVRTSLPITGYRIYLEKKNLA